MSFSTTYGRTEYLYDNIDQFIQECIDLDNRGINYRVRFYWR